MHFEIEIAIALHRFYVKSTLENEEVLKLPFFTIFGALNFVNFVEFSLQKVHKFMKNKHSEPLKSECVKMADLALLHRIS